MLNIIRNNPYRYLGGCSNAPIAERLANSRKMNAFLKVNKQISMPIDLSDIIGPIERNIDGVNAATSSITQPTDQLKYALFWFINANRIDDMAIEYIKNGNIDKAKELFEKKDTFSSLINRGILSFIADEYGEAINVITRVIHDDEYRCAFVETICGTNFQIEEESLAKIFMDTLLEEVPVNVLKNLFVENGTSGEDDEYLSSKLVDEPIANINKAIAQAKAISNDDYKAQYKGGIKLINSTKEDLESIQSVLDKEDIKYQMVADNLAKQILQCGINYYNNSDEFEDEYERLDKAYKIQNYALKIAVGRLTRERCKENVDIIERKKKELPPKEVSYYDKRIKLIILNHMVKPKKIKHSIELIKEVIPFLMSICEVRGANDPYYLQISTLIVNMSLHNVIEEFNSTMSDDMSLQLVLDRARALKRIKEVLDQAWEATLYMDQLDMESDFKNGRYKENRESLKSQVSQFININKSIKLDKRGENKIFNECKTIAAYNNYLKIFPDGKYAHLVPDRIEKIEFDACKTTQQCQQFKDKYPSTKYPLNEKWEECFFKQCSNIATYESYIKNYPNGKYVSQAKSAIDKLYYEACRSISEYQSYISNFPNGAYLGAAKSRIEELRYKSCKTTEDFKNYMRGYPNGMYYEQARKIVEDEELWAKCIVTDSKNLYKEYLAKFPYGRHNKEAEEKAKACYIATMVYGDYNHPQVMILRNFRDNTLGRYRYGRLFIQYYYKYSPMLVEKLQNKRKINMIIRYILDKFIKLYKDENK